MPRLSRSKIYFVNLLMNFLENFKIDCVLNFFSFKNYVRHLPNVSSENCTTDLCSEYFPRVPQEFASRFQNEIPSEIRIYVPVTT